VQIDPQVNFNWGLNDLIPNVASNYISIEWNGFLTVPSTDSYIFTIFSNDGVRLTINQTVIFDNLTIVVNEVAGLRLISKPINLIAGQFIPIQVEYF